MEGQAGASEYGKEYMSEQECVCVTQMEKGERWRGRERPFVMLMSFQSSPASAVQFIKSKAEKQPIGSQSLTEVDLERLRETEGRNPEELEEENIIIQRS